MASRILLAVASATNQPAGCEVFYQVDIRMKNRSFFLGLDTNKVYTRVFRAKEAVTGPFAHPTGMTFELKKADASVPWRDLTFPRWSQAMLRSASSGCGP